MHHPKKTIFVAILLGTVVGAGSMKYAYEEGILEISRNSGTVLGNLEFLSPLIQSDTEKLQKKTPQKYRFVDTNTPIKKENVCELQELLRGYGVYTSTVDGKIGQNTAAAIRKIQKRFRLEENGKATTSLLTLLRTNAARDTFSNTKKPQNTKIIFSNNKERIAPLEIRTSRNTGDYLIKLENSTNGKEEMSFFVRGGQVANVNVPLGSYNLKYVNGRAWYGRECLFGIHTTYSKAGETFIFEKYKNSVTAITVELILQQGGNLSTKKIAKQDW